jgi:fumarylacetoacetase
MTKRLTSWVTSANSADTDFPLNNLPYGVFSGAGRTAHCGVAIGDQVLDVTAAEAKGLFTLAKSGVFAQGSWNAFMALDDWSRFRLDLLDALSQGSEKQSALELHLVAQADCQMLMPFTVTEFTDFYAGRHHATNVGTMFRGPENALPPNWLHMPIGYNGRASSVVVSGTDVIRPHGQLKGPDEALPRFALCARFDHELEMGAIVGRASSGRISVDQANENIFGYVLLNDWSARDIQAWEYQPLGPFQAKATATTISPWIVTKEALEPFRTTTPVREFELLEHIKDTGPMLYNIDLDVVLTTSDGTATTIAKTNYNEMYYSAAQQLAHHSSSGCPMRVGDLIGSGTISGPNKENRGSMLELSWGGKEPLTLANGQTRNFLEDGDQITLAGASQSSDYRIGFGECIGRICSSAAGIE